MTPETIYKLFGFYDPKWCIPVERKPYFYESVRCIHPMPHRLSANSSDIRAETNFNESIVTLNAYAENNIRLGFAGRCDTCGKVYYVR